MTLLSQAKTLGGVGSVLVILASIPGVGWLVSLIGFILVLIAVKYVSDSLADRSIFNNMIISVVAAIAGVVVGGLYIVASVLSFFHVNLGNMGTISQAAPTFANGQIMSLITTVVGGLLVVWIALIVSAVFLRRSYSTMGSKLNVGTFNTAALLYLIGAVTAIIFIGFVILLVAEIVQIIAFFSLPEAFPQSGAVPQPQQM